MSDDAAMNLWLQYDAKDYRLVELDTGITSTLNDGGWRGYLLFACYSAITSNQVFRTALEIMLKAGFAGRVMGDLQLCKLEALHITRRLSVQQQADYGDGIHALVRIEYVTMRDWAQGAVKATAQGFVIQMAATE